MGFWSRALRELGRGWSEEGRAAKRRAKAKTAKPKRSSALADLVPTGKGSRGIGMFKAPVIDHKPRRPRRSRGWAPPEVELDAFTPSWWDKPRDRRGNPSVGRGRRRRGSLLGEVFGALVGVSGTQTRSPRRSSAVGAALERRRTAAEAKVDATRAIVAESRRRNPGSPLENLPGFAAARALAREIHGDGHGTVVELADHERPPGWGRFAAFVGKLEEMVYRTPAGSKRAGVDWVHELGDRGPLLPAASERPNVVADPASRRIAIVDGRSPLRVVKGWLSG